MNTRCRVQIPRVPESATLAEKMASVHRPNSGHQPAELEVANQRPCTPDHSRAEGLAMSAPTTFTPDRLTPPSAERTRKSAEVPFGSPFRVFRLVPPTKAWRGSRW